MSFLIIAGLAGSLVGFRKPFIQALLAEGITVHAAAPELLSNDKVKTELESMGVVLHDVPMARTGMNPFLDLKTLWALYKLMKQLKPDYSMGYTIKPVIYGGLAAWLAKVPYRFALITGLGYAFVDNDNFKRKVVNQIVVRLYKAALSNYQCVFFQNTDDEALFREISIVQPTTKTVVVNGSGVPVDEYIYEPASAQSNLNFFLMARLIAAKGVRVYADAVRIVKKQYPNANFILVGALDSNPDGAYAAVIPKWTGAMIQGEELFINDDG